MTALLSCSGCGCLLAESAFSIDRSRPRRNYRSHYCRQCASLRFRGEPLPCAQTHRDERGVAPSRRRRPLKACRACDRYTGAGKLVAGVCPQCVTMGRRSRHCVSCAGLPHRVNGPKCELCGLGYEAESVPRVDPRDGMGQWAAHWMGPAES